eukprot:Phypoly_transcript_13419.p1 GENE.Phypoly_transcript_13419~~Phypoly_transcript_13419.p1  ORF type:complete len:293 (+),score=53.58 Phypoly_transcript_13419:3-881(+)
MPLTLVSEIILVPPAVLMNSLQNAQNEFRAQIGQPAQYESNAQIRQSAQMGQNFQIEQCLQPRSMCTTTSSQHPAVHSDPTDQATNATLLILDALMNLVRGLERTGAQSEQVEIEIRSLKNLIDGFLVLFNAQRGRPREMYFHTARFILDPTTIRLKDCNESFLRIFGAEIDTKQKFLGINVKSAFRPFLRKLVTRDFAWFMKNKITCAERIVILPHMGGDVVYAIGTFEVMGPNYAVFTLSSLCDSTPRCLQITYSHYLGLKTGGELPTNECTMKYCHCKMLHIPLEPSEI